MFAETKGRVRKPPIYPKPYPFPFHVENNIQNVYSQCLVTLDKEDHTLGNLLEMIWGRLPEVHTISYRMEHPFQTRLDGTHPCFVVIKFKENLFPPSKYWHLLSQALQQWVHKDFYPTIASLQAVSQPKQDSCKEKSQQEERQMFSET